MLTLASPVLPLPLFSVLTLAFPVLTLACSVPMSYSVGLVEVAVAGWHMPSAVVLLLVGQSFRRRGSVC